MKAERRRAYRWGIHAEQLAGWYLRAKGYRILAGRSRNPLGEIDILARRGNTLAAVEVKARKTFEQCEESIAPWKQQRIARAMEMWLASASMVAGWQNYAIRFDVIWITPWHWPRHIKDAWRP